MLIDGVAGRDGGGGGGGDSDPCRVSANINNLSVLNKKKLPLFSLSPSSSTVGALTSRVPAAVVKILSLLFCSLSIFKVSRRTVSSIQSSHSFAQATIVG